MQQLARNKQVSLPTEPDAKHRAMADKLNSLTGDAFERAYLSGAGLSDHEAAHKLLAQADKRVRDSDLTALVEKLPPVIDHHLDEVRPLAKNKGG